MDVRRTGRIFGWLFLGTFVTSIPARLLFIDGGRIVDSGSFDSFRHTTDVAKVGHCSPGGGAPAEPGRKLGNREQEIGN